MDLLTTFGIAVALAMDAFAVAVSTGLVLGKVSGRQTFRLSFHFGLFQALMPILGWFAGRSVADAIAHVDHWVVLGLLSLIGGKMIWDGLGHREDRPRGDPTRRLSLIMLSIATSIDALAVGVSLALIGVEIWRPALIIGLVAALFTIVGLHLGRRLGARLGPIAEVMGGLVLIGIGIRVVIEHLAA
jgi:manganese efflux pump family protein